LIGVSIGPIAYSSYLAVLPQRSAAKVVPPVAACEAVETGNPDTLPRKQFWQFLEVENTRRPGAVVVGRLIDLWA